MPSKDKPTREALTVAAFACLLVVPFLGKAYHLDEPYFLAIARQILRDPFHPFAFTWNWDNRTVSAADMENTPLLMPYLLALALKASGGAEWATRLFFLPIDVLTALALHGLARRFLARPLLPVLVVMAAPAYFINLDHVMAEKLTACLGFTGLWALVASYERERRWFWVSALLLGLGVIAKYNAVLFLPPALVYALHRGTPPPRLAGYLVLAGAPLAVHLLVDIATGGGSPAGVWGLLSGSQAAWWSAGAHKPRSFLAFVGGGGLVLALWPYRAFRRGAAPAVAASAAAAAALFLPAFDLGPVRGLDRALGVFFAAGALFLYSRLFTAPARAVPGWPLWAAWLLSASAVAYGYWSVVARMTVHLLPPATFLLAGALERVEDPRALRRLYAASLAAVLVLGLVLAAADYRYAGAQKEIAREVSERYLSRGRAVWFAGHWGLQHYLEERGARALDWNAGAWEDARPGDVIVVPTVNTRTLPPRRPFLADVHRVAVDSRLPLRLMNGGDGQAAFYSNAWGFLPYAPSGAPLDEFSFIELR